MLVFRVPVGSIIRIILPFPRLLFKNTGAELARFNSACGLIQCPIWIIAHVREQFLAVDIAMVGHLIELRVQLQARRNIKWRGDADLSQKPETHSLPHIRRVGIVRFKGGILNPATGAKMSKLMLVVEFESM